MSASRFILNDYINIVSFHYKIVHKVCKGIFL